MISLRAFILSLFLLSPFTAHAVDETVQRYFLQAIEEGDNSAAERLLGQGADANYRTPYSQAPLYVAITHNRIDMIPLLLTHGADKDATFMLSIDDKEQTIPPLLYALLLGQSEITMRLLDAGVNVQATNSFGQNALHIAAQKGNTRLLRRLIQMGVDSKAADTICHCTPLHYAVLHQQIDAFILLLEQGADSTLPDQDGRTVLHYAISQNNPAIVSYLLDHTQGTLANRPDNIGQTPLHLAAQSAHPELISMLLSQGATINTQDNQGRSALYLAIESKKIHNIQTLISNGADTSLKEKTRDETALDLAVRTGITEAIMLLQKTPQK